MEIFQKISNLKNRFACIVLSDIDPAPKDIDVLCKEEYIIQVRDELVSDGFVCEILKHNHLIFRKCFDDGNFYVIDVFADFFHTVEFYPEFMLSTEGNKALKEDIDLYLAFKNYIKSGSMDIILRDTKLKDFLYEHSNFECGSYLIKNIKLNLLLQIRVKILLKKLLIVLSRMINLFSRRRGKVFVFVGPDGSGKSFIIEKISQVSNSKLMYLGNYFFYFQGFYNFLMKYIPSPLNRIVYLFYQIEKFVRFLICYVYVFFGYTILVDRFPGTNRNILHSGWKSCVNSLSFSLTPKFYMTFVYLHATPEVVYSRKQELSLSDISKYQVKLFKLLSVKNKIFVLDTQQSSEGLNFLLKKVYEI